MLIKFSRKQAQEMSILWEEPFNFNKNNLRWEASIEINLQRYDEEVIRELKKEVDANFSIRGFKTISRDIEMFLSITTDPTEAKKARITSTKKAESFIYARMVGLERKWIYSVINEGGENRWLAYAVTNIAYEPASKWTPEHIYIHTTFFYRNEEGTARFTLWPGNLVGKTVDQAFESINLKIENPVLRDNYEEEAERYEKLVDDVGKKFVAVGTATNAGVDESSNSWRWQSDTFNMEKDGEPSQVVIDVTRETEKTERSNRRRSDHVTDYWTRPRKIKIKDSDEELESDGDEEEVEDKLIEFPLHPYVTIFDLKKHIRLTTHVTNLTEYVYDTKIQNRLVLPKDHQAILDCLMKHSEVAFADVIKNKAGGTIILSQGPPGTGKTLTAEIYAESLKRPLYTVQCSQLGLTIDALESNLNLVLNRGKRWRAITLLDEADVYVHHRGDDLHQNAIVGVFLRILEYHTGVLFLTTNRGDLVDDAILSRCTIRIPYSVPSVEDQKKIWKTLAEANGFEMSDEQVENITDFHNDLSGRDIKNLMKLCLMLHNDPKMINDETITTLRVYKPTTQKVNNC